MLLEIVQPSFPLKFTPFDPQLCVLATVGKTESPLGSLMSHSISNLLYQLCLHSGYTPSMDP